MSQRSRGEGFQKLTATAVGTNAGVTATITAPAGAKPAVTHISCSGDGAALVTLEIPTGTVVWKKRFAAAFTVTENFAFAEWEGSVAGTASVKVSASTTNSEANIGGVALSVS